MGVLGFRYLLGSVLAAVAGVAAAQAGTVPPFRDVATVESPVELDSAAPASLRSGADFGAGTLQGQHDITAAPAGHIETTLPVWNEDQSDRLLLLGDLDASDPTASGFSNGSFAGGSSLSNGPQGSVLSPAPEQVLIPLPSAAWTGLTGLAGLGIVSMMKHVRRFLR